MTAFLAAVALSSTFVAVCASVVVLLQAWRLRLAHRVVHDHRRRVSDQTIELEACRVELQIHADEICRLMEANDQLYTQLQERAT